MDKRELIKGILKEQRLMPLFYHSDESTSIGLMQALYRSGVRLIEYTNRGDQALSNFSAMKKEADSNLPGLYLGAGTIKSDDVANKFIDAGADFLISPALAEEVYDVAYSNKILWIPGCMTPTEILKAEQYGISLVKLFPGNILGPSFVQAIRELFPAMSFMPTGGVETSQENLKSWFDAGVVAVGMGSKLLTKHYIENKSYDRLTADAKRVLGILKEL